MEQEFHGLFAIWLMTAVSITIENIAHLPWIWPFKVAQGQI